MASLENLLTIFTIDETPLHKKKDKPNQDRHDLQINTNFKHKSRMKNIFSLSSISKSSKDLCSIIWSKTNDMNKNNNNPFKINTGKFAVAAYSTKEHTHQKDQQQEPNEEDRGTSATSHVKSIDIEGHNTSEHHSQQATDTSALPPQQVGTDSSDEVSEAAAAADTRVKRSAENTTSEEAPTKRVRKLKRGLKLCSNITCYIEQVLYNC